LHRAVAAIPPYPGAIGLLGQIADLRARAGDGEFDR
jgi:hypothetical protein